MDSICDRALKEIGQNGKFQWRFDLVYNVLFVIVWSMTYMNIILALVITPHHCMLPNKPDYISDYDWKLRNIPTSDDGFGNKVFSKCLIYLDPLTDNSTKECKHYDFDKTWYESTVASDNNWVCNEEMKIVNVFSFSKIGEIVGSIFFGWFGDAYGRRPTYIISCGLLIIGRIISIMGSHSYTTFLIGCIISYVPSWSAIQTTNVISVEISCPERRSTIATLRLISYSFGVGSMSLLFWWIREWKLFLVVTSLPLVPFFIFSCFLIESPRWLWLDSEPKKCIIQLRKIAKVNNNELSSDTQKDMLNNPYSKDTATKSLGPLVLFSSCKLATNTIYCNILWVSVTLSYTVLIMATGEKRNGNPFMEFTLQSVAEIPGNFLAAWIVDNLGRRYAGMISYSTAAIAWILTAIFYYFKSCDDYWWIGTVLVIIARMSTSISYFTVNLFNLELYPTNLRQSGMSLGNVISGASSAFVPYILYMGRTYHNSIPAMILSLISISAIMSSYQLPETLNADLPETLRDAQNFGKTKYTTVCTTTTYQNNNDKNVQVEL